MTVIAVRKYEDKIVIAADSQGTCGRNKLTDLSKIYKEGDLICACAGKAQDASMMRMFIRTHKPKSNTEEDIIDFLSEFVDWKKKKTNNCDYVGAMIIVFNGALFHIESYATTLLKKDFFAIGSGMFLAFGAMELGATPKEAAEVALKYDIGCGGEIEVLEIPIKNNKE